MLSRLVYHKKLPFDRVVMLTWEDYLRQQLKTPAIRMTLA